MVLLVLSWILYAVMIAAGLVFVGVAAVALIEIGKLIRSQLTTGFPTPGKTDD